MWFITICSEQTRSPKEKLKFPQSFSSHPSQSKFSFREQWFYCGKGSLWWEMGAMQSSACVDMILAHLTHLSLTLITVYWVRATHTHIYQDAIRREGNPWCGALIMISWEVGALYEMISLFLQQSPILQFTVSCVRSSNYVDGPEICLDDGRGALCAPPPP